MRETGSKYLSKSTSVPSPGSLGHSGPCPDPCPTPARPLSWIRPSPFASHHHILARAWKTPRPHTHLPDRTTLHHTHRSKAGVPVCLCCALSPARRSRPSVPAPTTDWPPVPHPHPHPHPRPRPLQLSSSSGPSGQVVSFLLSLARSPPLPPFYLLSNHNIRPTILVPALAHPSAHWSDRIRESRLTIAEEELPESVEALQASRRVGSGQIRLAAPHSAPPSVLSPPCLPVICPPGVDASHLSSASLPIRERCLCSLAVSRPSAPLPAARHDRQALDKSPLPPALQQTRHPLPPRPQVCPPPASPSLSLKPAKPPRRQFPPFLALALVEF